MLKVENIKFTVPDGKEILKGVDLVVNDGETVVITGPNGSGKTTFAKVIAGVEKATEGRIFLNDIELTDMDITERAQNGIAYGFQQPVRFKGITARNLMELAARRELTETETCNILGMVGLCTKDYIDREISTALSGGEIKRIEIATVFTRDAEIYIFDEPEAGIDLWSFNNLIEVFKDLKNEKKRSILIISHQERILEIADKIAVIDEGRITGFGTREEILPKLCQSDIHCPGECDLPYSVKEVLQ